MIRRTARHVDAHRTTAYVVGVCETGGRGFELLHDGFDDSDNGRCFWTGNI